MRAQRCAFVRPPARLRKHSVDITYKVIIGRWHGSSGCQTKHRTNLFTIEMNLSHTLRWHAWMGYIIIAFALFHKNLISASEFVRCAEMAINGFTINATNTEWKSCRNAIQNKRTKWEKICFSVLIIIFFVFIVVVIVFRSFEKKKDIHRSQPLWAIECTRVHQLQKKTFHFK